MTRNKDTLPAGETAAARRNAATPCYVVGLSGGSASGKSTLAAALAQRLEAFQPVVLNQDRYFHDWSELPPLEREARMTANHPDAVRWEPLVEHVARLRYGGVVDGPVPGTRGARQG